MLSDAQRPKLSDPARETRGLQPERDGRVRCSAWLGRVCIHSNPIPGPALIGHEELTVKSAPLLPDRLAGMATVELPAHVVSAEASENCAKLPDALRLANALVMLCRVSDKPATLTAAKLRVKQRRMPAQQSSHQIIRHRHGILVVRSGVWNLQQFRDVENVHTRAAA